MFVDHFGATLVGRPAPTPRTPEIGGMVIKAGPWGTNPLARDPKAPQGSSELSQSGKTRLSAPNAVRVLVGPILS